MKQILAIVRKELNSYFGSPMALIFIGVFLLATLFSFFWIDTFFARGIADARSLFRWMPLLIVFLLAALTMRQWSEEEQTGTIEILLTLPVRLWQLVIGKFISVMILVILALLLTLTVPYSVSSLGNLDWGPVIGGYLAAILMAAAYAAIGLFISSRTNNQIVALILSTLVCGLFYFVGTSNLMEFFGERTTDILRAISTSSHFESIERGVIDIRDLVYYLSLAIIFLGFNVLSLDSKRWSRGSQIANYQTNAWLAAILLAVNLIVLNIWLFPLQGMRLDLTEQKEYTLSTTTTDLLSNLTEPLLLRAYFSERTHPLLSPLVPRIRDMLREYEVAARGNVTVEIVDPAQEPDLEAEANQTYGIRPTPFQIAGRYESSVVNAYFDILVRFGDQSEILNFRDLIEVESFRDSEVDVRLRNLEYDLTRAIKKSVFGFQSIDAVLASLESPAKLTLIVTPDMLPEEFVDVVDTVERVAAEFASGANDNFSLEIVNPDDPAATLNRQALFDNYGLQPFAVSLFSAETYYLHMLLKVGDQIGIIYPTGEMTDADIRTSLESTLKRAAPGFLKTVGIWRPVIGPDPTLAQFGQTQQPPFSTWNMLAEQLRQEYEVRSVDLTSGEVPSDIDVLVVVAPQGMSDAERFAIDQYLMRGGALIVASNNHRVAPDPFQGMFALTSIEDGMQEMLSHYGIDVQDALVLDPQNEPFPIQMQRQVGNITVQEIQALNYPYFVDVRSDGMSEESPIIASLPAVTLNWVSPVIAQGAPTIDSEEDGSDESSTENDGARDVTVLLRSSPDSWLRSNLDIQPDTDAYPELGFPVEGERSSHPLAVSIRGSFGSFFKDKETPTQSPPPTAPGSPNPESEAEPVVTTGRIDQSPDTARMIVIGSADFLNDDVFQISSQISFDRYLNSLQFLQNAVDWSVEDIDLLNIRSRGTHARLLKPLTNDEQALWEYRNYVFVIVVLIAIGLIWAFLRRSEQPLTLIPPSGSLRKVEQGSD